MELLTKTQISDLEAEISGTIKDLDIPSKKSRLGELQTKSMEENFWQNQEEAKKILSEISRLQEEIKTVTDLEQSIQALTELFAGSNDSERAELLTEYSNIRAKFEQFQKLKYLSGKYDKSDAILSIHSGQGGTEANDWAEMLLRMYKMFCEKQGWQITMVHMVPGTETGISSVTLQISGIYAFGYLKRESGVHRLVRLSPFNAQNLRQTSFAGVEVIPIMEENNEEIVIPENEIDFKAVRSSGPGGQNVNKTSTAVQITHIPTGITVHSSEQRSQLQNRQTAMRILQSRLLQIKEEQRDAEMRGIKGEHKIAGWGNQIRNYVLHPYKLVKDLRTGIESYDPESILAGELDVFVEAQLRLK